MAHVFEATDREAVRREEAEFGVFRGVHDVFRGAGGSGGAAVLDAGTIGAFTGAGKPISLSILGMFKLLKKRLLDSEAGPKNEELMQLLINISGRMDAVQTLTEDLAERIDAIRKDAKEDVDFKFATVQEDIRGFGKKLAKLQVAFPDCGPYFVEKLGQRCWNWLGESVQRMLTMAEDFYNRYGRLPLAGKPDYTPALLELCRGLELLLNEKLLREVCSKIAAAVSGNPAARINMARRFPKIDMDKALKIKGSASTSQVAWLLRIGKEAQAVPNLLSPSVTGVLNASPGIAELGTLAVLALVGTRFRNDKIHPYPASADVFTSIEELRVVRKLILGIDERRAERSQFLNDLSKLACFGPAEAQNAKATLECHWRKFPGIVSILWQTVGGAAAMAAWFIGQ